MSLKINIENLPKKGGTYDLTFNNREISVDEVDGEVDAQVNVRKKNNLYEVKGCLTYDLNLTCARCLDIYTSHEELEIKYELKRKTGYRISGEYQEEVEGEEKELFFDGNIIDMESIFHDEIMLSIPMKPLCRRDCRGLCPVCGANLNRTTCEHVDEIFEKNGEIVVNIKE